MPLTESPAAFNVGSMGYRLGKALSVVACLPSLLAPRLARADAPPADADRIRSAASEYDAGRRAFMDKQYESAAAHFENAFHDAPRAEALRNAIRARVAAGELARAATLSSLARSRYGDDAPTMRLVKDTLAQASPRLHEVTLRCRPACGAAADGRAISIEDSESLVFYLEPGPHSVVASWGGGRAHSVGLAATAGGHEAMDLEAPSLPPPVPPPPPPSSTLPVPGSPRVEKDVVVSSKPLGPAVFLTGLGLTAVGAAAAVVSGLDARSHPGTDAVRRDCVGLGESCPEYQQGLDAQLRTNVLLAVTGGVALTTAVIGVFFTQWSHPQKLREEKAALVPVVSFRSIGVRGSF